jgi:hypothetical protein
MMVEEVDARFPDQPGKRLHKRYHTVTRFTERNKDKKKKYVQGNPGSEIDNVNNPDPPCSFRETR